MHSEITQTDLQSKFNEAIENTIAAGSELGLSELEIFERVWQGWANQSKAHPEPASSDAPIQRKMFNPEAGP